MRKHKLFIGIFILVLVLLIGAIWRICNPGNGTVSQISLSQRDGLRLEVKSIDYEKKLVTLRLINESDDDIDYRSWEWAMDRKKGSEWYHIKKISPYSQIDAFYRESESIRAGEIKEHSYKWSYLYGNVGCGIYRIYFELLNEDGNTEHIGVEFTINGWKELFS